MRILILLGLNILSLCASQNVESSWYFPRSSAMLRNKVPLLTTLIQAPDPLEFLQRTIDEVVVNEARDQSASMAEYYLGLYDMSCVQRSFCEVATAARTDLMETPEQAAQLSMSVIKKMSDDLSETKKKKFKNVQKLVAAYNVGTSTKNVTLCQWLFPCEKKILDEEEVDVQTRVKCKPSSKFCPAFSISCAMCGMFMPQACVGVCPMAGLYCGVAGYACKLNKEKSPKLEIASPEPVAVLGEEEAEIPPRARNEELEMFDFVGRKNIKSILARQTASESKPINIETRSKTESGDGTGDELEMFKIVGRKNVEFARKTASEAKPITFKTRSKPESGDGTGDKLEMLKIVGRKNVEIARKTASEAKPIDNGEEDDMRNLKNAKMAEMKEEDFYQMEAKTSEFEETQIES